MVSLAAALGYFATHPTVRIERVYIAPTTTTTMVPNLPPGVSYQAVKAAVLLELHYAYASTTNVGKGMAPFISIECVLPNTWAAGKTFQCTTFDRNNVGDGTAAVSIETPDPGQQFTIVSTWNPY